MSGKKHARDEFCWGCLPDVHVAGFEKVPGDLHFLPASPIVDCPFLSGDEPDDGRMYRPPHVFGVNEGAALTEESQ